MHRDRGNNIAAFVAVQWLEVTRVAFDVQWLEVTRVAFEELNSTKWRTLFTFEKRTNVKLNAARYAIFRSSESWVRYLRRHYTGPQQALSHSSRRQISSPFPVGVSRTVKICEKGVLFGVTLSNDEYE